MTAHAELHPSSLGQAQVPRLQTEGFRAQVNVLGPSSPFGLLLSPCHHRGEFLRPPKIPRASCPSLTHTLQVNEKGEEATVGAPAKHHLCPGSDMAITPPAS